MEGTSVLFTGIVLFSDYLETVIVGCNREARVVPQLSLVADEDLSFLYGFIHFSRQYIVDEGEFFKPKSVYAISSSSCRAASMDIPDPLSLHVSLSLIASGMSSGLHPVSSRSCCKFELVVLLLIGHMRGSTGVHHLRARPCFSSSVRHVWFV